MNSQSPTRVFTVHYKTWNIAMQITDPASGQELYTLSSGGALGTNTEVRNSQCGGQVIGLGKSSHFSSSVTITTPNNGASFATKTSKMMGMGSPSYYSPAFGGRKMTWKNKALSSKYNYTLIDDETGMPLAKFESAGMKFKKVGKLEIMTDQVTNAEQMDEVVVTVLTLLYRKLVAANTAAVAGAGSSS